MSRNKSKEGKGSKHTLLSLSHILTIVLIVIVFVCGTIGFFGILEGVTDSAESFIESVTGSSEDLSVNLTFYDLLQINEDTYWTAGIIIIVCLGVAALLALIEFIGGLKSKKKGIHYLSFLTGIVLIVGAVLLFSAYNLYESQFIAIYEDQGIIGSLLADVASGYFESVYTVSTGYYLMSLGTVIAGVWEILVGIVTIFRKK